MGGADSFEYCVVFARGDPLMPALFNNVMRKTLDILKPKCARLGLGATVCNSSAGRTSHATFAADTSLFAANRERVEIMLADVHEVLATFGLNLDL